MIVNVSVGRITPRIGADGISNSANRPRRRTPREAIRDRQGLQRLRARPNAGFELKVKPPYWRWLALTWTSNHGFIATDIKHGYQAASSIKASMTLSSVSGAYRICGPRRTAS